MYDIYYLVAGTIRSHD